MNTKHVQISYKIKRAKVRANFIHVSAAFPWRHLQLVKVFYEHQTTKIENEQEVLL